MIILAMKSVCSKYSFNFYKSFTVIKANFVGNYIKFYPSMGWFFISVTNIGGNV